MSRRRCLRHQSAFFGLAVFGMVFVLAAKPATAAPSCSQVLIIHSADNIQIAIADLAKMKIQLDLSLSEGAGLNKAASKSLKILFPQKYQELITKLSAQYSEAEVRLMVTNEITRLQSKITRDQESERAVRVSQEHELRIPYQYTLTSSSENLIAPDSSWRNRVFHFLEKSDSLVFKKDHSVVRYLMKENEYQTISKALISDVRVSKDEKFIYTLSSTELSIFDTILGETIKSINKIKSSGSETQFEVDPTNRFALVANNMKTLEIWDLLTEQVHTFTKDTSPIGNWFRELTFLDSDHIAFRSDGKIKIFNWKQNIVREGYVADPNPAKLQVSKDLQRLYLIEEMNHKTFVKTFDITDIKIPLKTIDDVNISTGIHKLTSLPDANYVLIEGTNTTPTLDIYNIADFTKLVFRFKTDRQEGTEDTLGFAISSDGKTIVHAVKAAGSKKHYLDIWTQQK